MWENEAEEEIQDLWYITFFLVFSEVVLELILDMIVDASKQI